MTPVHVYVYGEEVSEVNRVEPFLKSTCDIVPSESDAVAVRVIVAGVVADVGEAENETVGGRLVPSGSVIVTEADLEVETFPAASFAQAYRVFDPADRKVYEVGGDPVQYIEVDAGAEFVSVSI